MTSDTEQDPDQEEVESEPGLRIGNRYELVECLGKGGSGTVFSCRDYHLGNSLIAIKIFPPRIASDTTAQARLAREIRSANRVLHDNVVRFYDLIQSSGFVAITMEYVNGPQLNSFIRPDRPPEIPFILDILRQTCLGLQAIHRHGIVHRDLKPENILIADPRIVKITDFGIATITVRDKGTGQDSTRASEIKDSHLNAKVTSHGQIIGTSEYISPEYIAHDICDHRSDIYALGVMTYELITGRYPFKYHSAQHLLRIKMRKDPPAPHLQRPDCPTRLSEFCVRAMQRDPEHRYQDIGVCLEEIYSVIQLRSAERTYKALSGPQRTDALFDDIPNSAFDNTSFGSCEPVGNRRSTHTTERITPPSNATKILGYRKEILEKHMQAWYGRLLIVLMFIAIVLLITIHSVPMKDLGNLIEFPNITERMKQIFSRDEAPTIVKVNFSTKGKNRTDRNR